MPRGDRTGPAGMGPMTGRRAGMCAGYSVPGFMNSQWRGVGRGMGPGGGWGHRHGANAAGPGGWQGPWMPPAFAAASPRTDPMSAMTRDQELEALKRQAGYVEQTLNDLNERIDAIESSPTDS